MPSFFKCLLIYMDRSILQWLRGWKVLAINQALCVLCTFVLCSILVFEQLDQYLMQSAFAALSLMLLQGVAAQRLYGPDMLVMLREAKVGMPMLSYFVAKDVSAFL